MNFEDLDTELKAASDLMMKNEMVVDSCAVIVTFRGENGGYGWKVSHAGNALANLEAMRGAIKFNENKHLSEEIADAVVYFSDDEDQF